MKTTISKKCLVLLIPLLMFILNIITKTAVCVENQYKCEKQEKRFQNSDFSRFHSNLERSFSGLEEKADNLEAMNQNLEGRINMLAAEKDKLNKAYVQMKAKQSALEKEHAKLKKRTSSLEVAYKKTSGKNKVATTSKKAKTPAKKTTAKSSQKGKSTSKTASNKGSSAGTGDMSTAQTQPPVVAVEKPSGMQRGDDTSAIDIKKINEKGVEYGKKGMYDEAIIEFQKVAAMEPNMANIHYNLGLAYKKKGMVAEAEKEFTEYERLKNQSN